MDVSRKVRFLLHLSIGSLVVLNAILTAEVISWRTVMHMCFLAFSHQYQHNFSFQSHRLLFSHVSADVRSENKPERKSRLNRGSNSQPPVHKSDTLTTIPPGRGCICRTISLIPYFENHVRYIVQFRWK